MVTTIEHLGDVRCALGENPLWDAEEERIYWIDVFGATVWNCDTEGRDPRSWKLPFRSITSFVRCTDGSALVTAGSQVHRVDLDTLQTEIVVDVHTAPTTSFNDGKVDRAGRFVTGLVDGTLFASRAPDPGGSFEPSCEIYLLDSGLGASAIADGFGAVNGPCFSVDGSTFFCSDSWARRIYQFDYSPTGRTSNRRVFAAFEAGLVPDGATVDAEGFLWVAVFAGAQVRRYAPDGTVDRVIEVPVTCPTSVAFGGPELDTLYVTSQGRAGFAGVQGQDDPLAGAVFAVRGVGVRGIVERRFEG